MKVDKEIWFDFFGIVAELSAITTIFDMDDDLRDRLNSDIRKLEDWRVRNLDIEHFEYAIEDCPHDYCTSKCTGCGYETG